MKQLTPPTGTKTLLCIETPCWIRNNLHPQRGRKLSQLEASYRILRETTYTPNGDENVSSNICFTVLIETTYTPNGDENNLLFKAACMVFLETTYTPNGDENLLLSLFTCKTGRNNLHPQRGRKHLKMFAHRQVTETTYTPNGDENREGHCVLRSFLEETTYTPNGDENGIIICAKEVTFQKQLTPPTGTKTCWLNWLRNI